MKTRVLLASCLLALALQLALAGPASAQIYGVGGRPPGTYGGYGGMYGPYAGQPYGGFYPGSAYGYGGYGMNMPYGSGYGQPYGGLYGYSVSPYGYGYGASPYGMANPYGYGGYPYGGDASAYYGGYGAGVLNPGLGGGFPAAGGYSSMYPQTTLTISNKMDKSGSSVTTNVKVKVPVADAEVWFGGVKTKQTGLEREFITPTLPAGKNFKYEVRALWAENGKEVERTETVSFLPGQNLSVDFTKPAAPEKKKDKDK